MDTALTGERAPDEQPDHHGEVVAMELGYGDYRRLQNLPERYFCGPDRLVELGLARVVSTTTKWTIVITPEGQEYLKKHPRPAFPKLTGCSQNSRQGVEQYRQAALALYSKVRALQHDLVYLCGMPEDSPSIRQTDRLLSDYGFLAGEIEKLHAQEIVRLVKAVL